MIAVAFALLMMVIPTASAVGDRAPSNAWQGGWSSEDGTFDAKNSLGGWYNLEKNATGADAMWREGAWGQGVGVAVIDTGSLPVPGLTTPGTIIDGLDISFDSQNPEILHLDGYGHGVHVAGLIAGNGGDMTPRNPSFQTFTGMAPGAHVLSVKAGASDGSVDVSQIIAAIDWVVQHKDDRGMNIRVLNLSFGFDSTQSPLVDPLSHAVENAWKAGIVVVAAAGNDGNAVPLRMPARNPYVISVGAYEQGNTIGEAAVLASSNCGDSTRSVDLVAPGKSIVGLRAPGSYLDEHYPNARAGTRYFKGTGTSQAAALVSGGVALLLSRDPSLTPDAVKNLLMDSAAPVTGPSGCGGAKAMDLETARYTAVDWTPQTWPSSTGTGSLDDARGSIRLELNGVVLDGEQDIFGTPWDAETWAAASADGSAWDGGIWNGLSWSGLSWSGLSWSGLSWSGLSWSGLSWSGLSWSGRSWSGLSWSGRSWSSGSWSGLSWSGRSWSNLS